MAKPNVTDIASRVAANLQTPEPRGVAGFLPRRPGAALDDARKLPLDAIDGNPQQARQMFDEGKLDELTASIAERGLLQPLVVTPDGERFMIVAGERRWRAIKRLHQADPNDYRWQLVPCIIRQYENEVDIVLDTAAENLQREDLTLTDEAQVYENLAQALAQSLGLDPERADTAIAKGLGLNRLKVWRARRIAKYPSLAAAVDNKTMSRREALERIQVMEDVAKGRTPSSTQELSDDLQIDRAELDLPDVDLTTGETLEQENEETIVHRELISGEGEAEKIVRSELLAGANTPRRGLLSATAPRTKATTWRPLFLADRNVSRLSERVTVEQIRTLPETERATLLDTVRQGKHRYEHLEKMLLEAEAS